MEPNQQQQSVQQKKLPSWLTTLTPFSKTLAMVLFISLPFLGFYLGYKYSEKINIPNQIVVQMPQNSASEKKSKNELLGNVFWNVSSGLISVGLEKDIKNAFSNFNTKGDFLGVESVNVSSISANFAIANMSKRDMNNVLFPADGFEFLLHKNNLKWDILTSNDSKFCNTLKLAPADILNDSRKGYYIGCFPK